MYNNTTLYCLGDIRKTELAQRKGVCFTRQVYIANNIYLNIICAIKVHIYFV